MARLPLDTPLSQMAIAPKTLARLHSLGLQRVFDLVLHLPLRYEDESHILELADLQPGQDGAALVTVVSREIRHQPRRTLQVVVRDDSGTLLLRFLNFYPSQSALFEPGRTLHLFGEMRLGFHGPEMIHPRCRPHEDSTPLPDHLTPVYPTCAGLSQKTLRQLIQKVLSSLAEDDPLPEKWRHALNLPEWFSTLTTLHKPDTLAATLPLMERMKFDELLAQQLSFQHHRRQRAARHALPLHDPHSRAPQLLSQLPFPLTSAQRRVGMEIRQDLARTFPMHRLLQGDVGCGKTIVATLAALQCLDAGHQVALMAPTELLAQQHYQRLEAWLRPLAASCWLLTSQLKSAEQARLRQRLNTGEAALVIGTHALIQDTLQFSSLALVIIDEQHRFGVEQRWQLTLKGPQGTIPHLLMMSATPIPRSLSMSYYADLDISTIDEIPPGRAGITTKLVASHRRSSLMQHILQACRNGQQAYWVCPLIEESEQLNLQNAQATLLEWQRIAPDLNCGLLHGKLPTATKSIVMEQFLKGQLQLLVATSVVEVGVDVPQATLMVIDHAERMGLAQLHQMRGRVGRGQRGGTCFLLYDTPLSDNARERLKVIYDLQDGFAIARQDLQQRGPGDYLGARQSGTPLLRFADPCSDESWLQQARHYSVLWLDQNPLQAQQFAELWLGARQPYLAA